jgi:hypothetical protein
MEADATQVAPDGSSIGTTMVTWVEPPHFFKSVEYSFSMWARIRE